MKNDRHPIFRFHALAAALALGVFTSPRADAQAPPGRDQVAFTQAEQLYQAAKYPEAIKVFESIQKDVPTSGFIPAANLQLGRCYFFTGDFDQGVAALRKNGGNQAVAPEIQEDSHALIPQLLFAKAQKEGNKDTRKAVLESAVTEFDAFLQKFPKSAEVEDANLGKARALYGLEKFEDAAVPLRTNLQKFPTSEAALETQAMLAQILKTQGDETLRHAAAPGDEKTAAAAYDEAEKLLRDIVAKGTDLALMNDAQFQLGEMFAARGSAPGAAKKDEFLSRAVQAYRNTYPNDFVVQRQGERVKRYQELMEEAKRKPDLEAFNHYKSVIPREQRKLAEFGQRGDQTLAAKLKCAQIYLEMHKDKERERMDEARVLYRFVEKFTKDPEQQKQALYGVTLTYAAQHLPEKAEEHFAKWAEAYKNDPAGENLPLVMGGMYLDPDPKVNDPKKAIAYFEKQAADFPKSKFTGQAAMQTALAHMQLQDFEKAAAMLKAFLETKPPADQAVGAEFGLATVYKDTSQADLAIATFRAVLNKYPGTEQAEQSGFWVGQMLFEKHDAKAAVTEIKAFLAKFPNSELVPNAMLTLGRALRDAGQPDAAVKTWQELAEKFPKSEAAPATFFQRAALLFDTQKFDGIKAVMKEFTTKYPDGDRVFAAYNYVAQIQSLQEKKPDEAIKTYEEFAAKYPADKDAPLAVLNISDQWKKIAEAMGLFVTIPQGKREEWRNDYDKCVEAAEKVLEKYPDSFEVTAALQNLLKAQAQFVAAKLKADSNVENYFNDLAKKYAEKPVLVSKVNFTLAGYYAAKDKEKSLKMMKETFDPKLVYSLADLETYAEALIQQKQYDEADKIADKMVADFPLPKNADPAKVARGVLEPTATSLFIKAKVLQYTGKNAESAKLFEQLKKEYPWSPKLLEADLAIGIDLFQKKEYDEAVKYLGPVARATSVAVRIPAQAVMTLGQISEARGDFDTAINNYIKVGEFYGAVADLAAEGYWRGAQLQEKKANGEVKQMPQATPAPEKKGGK